LKTQPLQTARIRFGAEDPHGQPALPGLPPHAPDFDAAYHPFGDPQGHAQRVFLSGTDLPRRWRRRSRFVILELGFGLGHNFLATWQAWRQDPQRGTGLYYVAVERYPPALADIQRAHRQAPWPDLAARLQQAWPPLTANLHPLAFDDGRVHLLLALGDVSAVLPTLQVQADAFFLDGFEPQRNPEMWQLRVIKALGRKAAPGATLAASTSDVAVRRALRTAGFTVLASPQTGHDCAASQAPATCPESTDQTPATRGDGAVPGLSCAVYQGHIGPRTADRSVGMADDVDVPGRPGVGTRGAEPRLSGTRTPDLQPAPAAAKRPPRTAVVVGAGLAGAAVAQALAQQGLKVMVLESQAEAAAMASGNAAGLFHGTAHADDGHHTRLYRAAAQAATRVYREALAAGVPGQISGLLRLELRPGGMALMQQWLQRHAWPQNYVQALSVQEASKLAGITLQGPAWFYPGGGWVSPPAWVRHALNTPGVQLQVNRHVASITRTNRGWQVHGAGGDVLAESDCLVLAHAASAGRLLQTLGHPPWPLVYTRGQITWLPTEPGYLLKLPLAGDGYVLPLPAQQWGQLPAGWLCGATSGPAAPADANPCLGDSLPAVTEADHFFNLTRLQRLAGPRPAEPSKADEHRAPPAPGPGPGPTAQTPLTPCKAPTGLTSTRPAPHPSQPLHGRAAWRLNSPDRLPVAGAVPRAPAAAGTRQDQLRLLPREPGLFVLTALGARGLTLAPLLGQLVAAQACGLPWPIEGDLADALDPGRWQVRAQQRKRR
jgi:tRNA 5-methylaminomethyl-2-thiouridine biosynthesis bifunctional protein